MKQFLAWCSSLLLTQLALLDAQKTTPLPPAERPELKFSFDAPDGPQFTEAEKEAQRARGKEVMPMVRKAFDSGADSVTLPPGDYRFGKETWDKDGPVYALDFRGLKRDSAKPFRILAHGVTFWFDLPPEQWPSNHFALGFVDCSHVTLEGAALDRDPRGCMEGRITQIDDAGNRIEIEATQGTLDLTKAGGTTSGRLVPFNADGTFCAAFYSFQVSSQAGLNFSRVEPGTAERRFWVVLDAKSELLKANSDPAWMRAYGTGGTLQVGDGLCLIRTSTTAIGVIGCTGMQIIGVSNYITKGCLLEARGGGGHLWKDCYFGPRPGSCHWQGSDGFLSGCMEHGSTLEGCTMLHTTDDLINFNGLWGYVEKVEDRTVSFEKHSKMPAQPGDQLNFFDKQTGAPLGTAVVESVNQQSLTLDRDAAPLASAVAENPRWQNNGWQVRNCDFRDCYQRFLIQGSSGGTLRNCRFTRIGSGIVLASNFFTHNEGGICRGVRVLDNVFDDVAIYPDGVAVAAGFQSLNHAASTPLLNDLTVRGNRFINSGRRAIEFRLVTGGDISGNTFVNSGQPRALAGKGTPKEDSQPVLLKQCADIVVKDNKP
jgi:Right handed beta helix region